MRNKNWTLSIVTPFYNEELGGMIDIYFQKIITELKKVAANWEIIAIDDGSTDNTFDILQSYHIKDNRIKVIKLTRNFGKEVALTAGLDQANGDAVIPLDADLQDPPALFKEMIDYWQQGYDEVIPIRATRQDPFLKKITANLFYGLINRISEQSFIYKNAGDFRLMDKKVINIIRELKEHHRFMKGLLSWPGFSQKLMEYNRPPREHGKTKYNYKAMLIYAIDGIFSFSVVPIRLITLFGFSLSFIIFCYGGYLIYQKLFLNLAIPGYTSTMVAILFLGGIQLTAIGIIGEYVGRIYNEVKKRPLYVVDKILQ